MAPPPRVAVAVSGGRDSTALLHCTARQAHALGIEVLALHVQHGLMPQAEAWLAQVRAQSRRWGAGFACARLSGAPAAGESIEAWARRERYHALATLARAHGCDIVLLAHHRRDQAETFLLQALRGAGAAGLSAMPRLAHRDGLDWARPWLDQPRTAIEAYVHRHRLRVVEDASNADPRHARSRLRSQVWPALEAAHADAETVLAAAARRAQEARALAEEIAALDLAAVLEPAAAGAAPLLRRGAWLALSPARRRNALRAWLRRVLPSRVPETLVERLCLELPRLERARWPAPGAELRLHRDRLSASVLPLPAAPSDCADTTGPAGRRPAALDLRRAGEVTLPGWAGRLLLSAGTGPPGAALDSLLGARPGRRQGGESFRRAPGAPARSLKKQYQAAGVAAWERDGPLLYAADGRLLFVAGLGVDGSCQAAPGQASMGLCWLAATPVPPSRVGG